MEGHVGQHIKESSNVGGRKVIEICAVVFVIIVTIPVFFLVLLLLFILVGKTLGSILQMNVRLC